VVFAVSFYSSYYIMGEPCNDSMCWFGGLLFSGCISFFGSIFVLFLMQLSGRPILGLKTLILPLFFSLISLGAYYTGGIMYEKMHPKLQTNEFTERGEQVFGEGNADEAISIFQEGLKSKNLNSGQKARLLHNLGWAYFSKTQYADSIRYFNESLQLKEETYGKEHIEVAWTLLSLGASYRDSGDFQNSEKSYLRAISNYQKAYGFKNGNIASCYHDLGILYIFSKRPDLAKVALLKSLIIWNELAINSEIENTMWALENIDVVQPEIDKQQSIIFSFTKSENLTKVLKTIETLTFLLSYHIDNDKKELHIQVPQGTLFAHEIEQIKKSLE